MKSSKSPEMEATLNTMTKQLFGRERRDDQCVICGIAVNPEKDFRDALSFKEFTISRMCQQCQDLAFTNPDEPEKY